MHYTEAPKFDLTNCRFGRLLAQSSIKINTKWHWKCLCDCGKEVYIRTADLKRGHCKSCGCLLIDKRNRFYEEIPLRFIESVKKAAKSRNLEYNITDEYIWNLYLSQNKKCALSNLDIVFNKEYQKHTASLDRIDSSKGYIERKCTMGS